MYEHRHFSKAVYRFDDKNIPENESHKSMFIKRMNSLEIIYSCHKEFLDGEFVISFSKLSPQNKGQLVPRASIILGENKIQDS